MVATRDNVGMMDVELRAANQALDDAIASATAAKSDSHFRWAETKDDARSRVESIKEKIRRLENVVGIRS